jgi:hypothetical protein
MDAADYHSSNDLLWNSVVSARGELTPIDDGLWAAERPFRYYGLNINTRMAVIRLPDGRLVLHSPIRFDAALKAAVDAVGPVAFLVAPNRYHHLALAEWVREFPAATLLAGPGLAKKRPDLPIRAELGDEPYPAWNGLIDQRLIRGTPALKEVALLHRPTRTLILADHLWYFEPPMPPTTFLAAILLGAYRKAGGFPWYLRSQWIKDLPATNDSIRYIVDDWDFDRVVLSHGSVLPREGKDALRRAYRL